MKLSLKGIGWLIAGGIICASATEAYGVAAKMSTIALGLVFVAVYLMKQIFKPARIGWFIAGGILVAFVVEEGLTEEGLFSLGIAAVCLGIFYFKNRDVLREIMDGGTLEYYPDEEETEAETVDPYEVPAYDPEAGPGEDPYAMPEYPADDNQEPEYPDDGAEQAGGEEAGEGSADGEGASPDSAADDTVDFEINMKE